jgi:hypothetical protein
MVPPMSPRRFVEHGSSPPAVILVEGHSDRAALAALAGRLGLDLAGSGVVIVPMGGATSIRPFVARYGPHGLDLRLAGLCDEREQGAFRRHLPDDAVFVCRADLEDELIRALGAGAVQQVIAAAGETATWERMRNQPAQRGRPVEHQLRRFMGTRSGRKERYATLLVDALDLAGVPLPLVGVLERALTPER